MLVSRVLMSENQGVKNCSMHKNDKISSKNVSFSGFTKQLGKKIFVDGQKDISKLLAEHPDTYPVCGYLSLLLINYQKRYEKLLSMKYLKLLIKLLCFCVVLLLIQLHQ